MNALKQIEQLLPQEIEKRSFEIIGEELAARGITLPKDQEMITKRVIHTSADFEYTKTLMYSKDAVRIAQDLICEGADIVTDTNMALAGINKKALATFGGEAHCFMADPEVARIAKERGTTRATVSMEMAARIDKPVIFAVGNAPTALIQIGEQLASGVCDRCAGRIRQCGGSERIDDRIGCALHCESWTQGGKQYCSGNL